MKINNYMTLPLLLFLWTSCQKEAEVELAQPGETPTTPATPSSDTSTSYQTLGTYDSTGKPNYLMPKDNVSSGMISYIKSTLVEKSDISKTNPDLLTKGANADIVITQSSEVLITYAYHNTIYANALAFYTYPTNKPPTSVKDIKSITYIFPNAGAGTPLRSGDKVKIGRFDPGTSIGFVLLKSGWNTSTKTLDNNAEQYFSTDNINPEADQKLKRHAVTINYATENKSLFGFENTNRTSEKCDNDFNDVVFYATLTP